MHCMRAEGQFRLHSASAPYGKPASRAFTNSPAVSLLVTRVAAFQDFGHIVSAAPNGITLVRPVRHEAPSHRLRPRFAHRWQLTSDGSR
jgi:hypothetical protein